MKKGYQVVWWYWAGFRFVRYDPAKTDWAYVYSWRLCLGFLEIRKWSVLNAPGR